jgi:hypothetical protein
MKKKKLRGEARKKHFNQKTFLKNLWQLWSIHIRSTGADWRGEVACFTCGKKQHWRQLDAGHYWHSVLDYDERNISPQCTYCNRYLHGNLQNYSLALLRKYGPTILDELEQAKKEYRKNPKPDLVKLKELYETLKNKYGHLV